MPHRQRSRLRRLLRARSRQGMRRLERLAPLLLAWIPSWGTSLLFHAALILLLALYLYARGNLGDRDGAFRGELIATQLKEDLNSMVDSDHAGDPFTALKTLETPSIAIEPVQPDVEVFNQPELPALERFAPELTGPELPREPGPAKPGAKGANYQLHAENMIAPFSGRQEMTRAQLVRREGGTVRSEKAVEDGLYWIIRHQRADGGWSLNFQGECRDGGCPTQIVAVESDTAATGLALLPLLGAGHTHMEKSRYQANVRRGLEWLVKNQQSDGDLFVGGGPMTHFYSHAIATMAISEAYGLSADPALRKPAERAIQFMASAQDPLTGGWRYVPGQPGDTSVFGWQMFALRSARLAGLKIPKNVMRGCKEYLDQAAADTRKVTYSYKPGGPVSPVMTAEALLSRQYMGWPRDFPPLVKGARHIAADLDESRERNIYYWYYATQLLHNMQNKDWERWNLKVREGLLGMQVKGEGCDRGSWDPLQPQGDRWGAVGGRLFLTSLSILTLEVYYRYLPLYRPTDSDGAGALAPPVAAAKPLGLGNDKGLKAVPATRE